MYLSVFKHDPKRCLSAVLLLAVLVLRVSRVSVPELNGWTGGDSVLPDPDLSTNPPSFFQAVLRCPCRS